MTYDRVRPAVFILRENRFIAQVALDGQPVRCHVKNTGRLKELLLPGATVYLQQAGNPARTTQWDLIAVERDGLVVNIDSQAPNRLFAEWFAGSGLFGGISHLKAEARCGASRLDFYFESGEGPGFVEVKGVTLKQGPAALFPDAPTERGIRHLRELTQCRREGLLALVAFVIQMDDVDFLAPNDATHPAFGEALREAAQAGVRFLALTCQVEPDALVPLRQVPVVI